MGLLAIPGYTGNDIDASSKTRSDQITTDTTTRETGMDPSQETETYDYTDDIKDAEGTSATTSDAAAQGNTQGPAQASSEGATGYNPTSSGGTEAQGTPQTGNGGNQVGTTTTGSPNTPSPGGLNSDGTNNGKTSLDTGSINSKGSNYNQSNAETTAGKTGSQGGMENNTGTEIKVSGSDQSMVTAEDIPDGDYFFHDGRAYIITGHNVDGSLQAEDMTEDFVEQLICAGIYEEDINRILKGEITLKDLFTEIQKDEPDSERFKKLMENSMIQAIKNSDKDNAYPFFVFNNMDELNEFINSSEKELAELIKERNTTDDHELDAIEQIILKLNEGYSLEQALNQVVAWSYVDLETGETKYVYTDPYEDMAYRGNYGDNYMYTPLTFEEMYGDSEYLQQIKDHCYEQEINHIFVDDEIVHRWDNFDPETQAFYSELLDKVYKNREERTTKLKELDAKIEALLSEIEYSKWVRDYVTNEYLYYNNNVRKYTRNEDFSKNCSYKPSITDDILNKLPKGNTYGPDGTITVFLNDKEDIVKFIMAMANGEIPPSRYIIKDGKQYQIASSNPLLGHYVDWLAKRDGEGNIPLSEEEIAVINYIYNTAEDPVEEIYNYLDFINNEEVSLADKLDERWLYRQQELDREFADKHPWLASIWSVIATPFEGISAAINSYSAVSQGYKIARCDVYSSGDTMRAEVSYNIGQKYGVTWQFVYDTGMSMADSLALIAVTYFTGGAGLAVNAILSATLMGSRAYVSTLNEALDRGLTDAQSVLLATTSAIVETAMESYSLGHLFNLEGALGNVSRGLATKMGSMFSNSAASEFMTKLTLCLAGSLSQGIAEGEEEFCTELLNTVCDLIIAKDKSKIEQSAAYYQKLGLSDAEISDRLMVDYAGQLWQAFKGGFFSGLVFGAFGSAKTTGLTSYGIANGMYDGNINPDASAADQFMQAIEYNQRQQEAAENVNSRYSLKDVIALVHDGATIQDALRSLKSGAVYNDAVIQYENGGTLTEQQMKVLEDYDLIKDGLVEQEAKVLAKEEIFRKLDAIFHGYEAPSLAQVIKTAQEADFEVSLYSGQFHPPEGLSNITREQQAYSDALFAMLKTAERLDLTKVGALEQLNGFVEGRENGITTRYRARYILRQYSTSELRAAYLSIRQNVLNDMNTEIQNAIDGVAQVCKISPYEASRLVDSYIAGQELSDLKFPSNFDYSTLDEIKAKYNIFTPAAGQIDYSYVFGGIDSYNRVLALQDRMNQLLRQLPGTSNQFKTQEDVLSYLSYIARTGDFQNLAATIRDSSLYHADYFEFARAVERLNNSYFETKSIAGILFNQFWNVLNDGKSDYNAASLLYQTLSISYSKGNQFAEQVIKTIMKIKQDNPNFHLTSQTYGRCFFNEAQSRIEIGKNHTAMLDQGTIMHELGHALWTCISKETLPTSWFNESSNARYRASNNANAINALNQLEQDLSNISHYCYNEATIRYENDLMLNHRKTINQYHKSLARSLSFKSLIFKNRTINNFELTLSKLGYSSKETAKLVKEFRDNGFNADKAARVIIDANIGKISDEISRTQYPDFCALSDIVSAMFYGRDQNGVQRDSNGRSIYVTYTHDNEYYTNYNRNSNIQTEIKVFHEVIANFTQLMMTGSNNSIYYLNHIFGQDFVDMLYGTFTSNINLNRYIQYPSTINFVKINETLRIIDAVDNMTMSDLPLRFSTVDDFHYWFINELLKNGLFDSKVDTIILERLLQNDIFNDTLMRNAPKIFDPHFEEAINSRLNHSSIFAFLSPTEFVTYLNQSTKATDIINNMTPTQLGNLLTNMGPKTLSWLYSPTIKNAILGYNAEQFSEFLESCEYLNLNVLYQDLSNTQWNGIIEDFYSKLIGKFINFNYLAMHPELASNIKNILVPSAQTPNARTAYEIADAFQYINLRIKALKPGDSNIESNKSIINNIIEETRVPSIFGSIEQYKEVFIKTLINSPVFAQLDNNVTAELINEPIFLNALAGSSKIDNLLIKNLDSDISARALLPKLVGGTQESFNKIFNTTEMNQYIYNLNAVELANLIRRMKDSKNMWMANETIVAKINSFNADEMAIFIEGLGDFRINDTIADNINSRALSKFFDKIIDFSTISSFENNPQAYSFIRSIYQAIETLPSTGNVDIDSKLDTIKNNFKAINSYIGNKIMTMASGDLASNMRIDSDSNVFVDVDSSYGYYNIIFEINGKRQIKTVFTPISFSDTASINITNILRDAGYYEAIAKGNFQLIEVSPNIAKDTLMLRGLSENGLYQAKFVVDGEEYVEIIRSYYGIADFSEGHETGKTFELKEHKYIGEIILNNTDDSKLYKMTYIENGITKVKYITSTGGTINLGDIILKMKTSNLDVSSIHVDPVTNPQELIAGLKTLREGIFASGEYGGNQSNPRSYLLSYFRFSGSLFEMDMGNRINDMIDSYFPELKTMREGKAKAFKLRLARLYGNSGCGYMALANAVTQYFTSLENGAELYQKAFGIPIQIDGKYTEEYLAISFCLSGISSDINGNLSRLNAGIIDDLGNQKRIVRYTTDFLSQRGINITTENFDAASNVKESLLSFLVSSPNSFHILLASQFDLEKLSRSTSTSANMDAALASSNASGYIQEKVGGHAMLVTEVTPAGELVVSSWRDKYKFIADSLRKYTKSWSGMWRVDISLSQDAMQTVTTAQNGLRPAPTVLTADTTNLNVNASSSSTINPNDEITRKLNIPQSTITDQDMFDLEILDILEKDGESLSILNLLKLRERYRTATGSFVSDINIHVDLYTNLLIDQQMLNDIISNLGTNNLRRVTENLSDQERINYITFLMLDNRILLDRGDFETLIPPRSTINNYLQEFQDLMTEVFKLSGLSPTDKQNIIFMITKLSETITSDSREQAFLEKLITDYCLSSNYQSTITNTARTSITVFKKGVFDKITSETFVSQLRTRLSPGALTDLDNMTNNIISALENSVKTTRPNNIALQNISGGVFGLLKEKFNSLTIDNYAPYMLYIGTDSSGREKIITLQAARGINNGATHHWYEISQTGTGSSISPYNSLSTVRTKIMNAATAPGATTPSTFKDAADILYNEALAKFCRGDFVEYPTGSGQLASYAQITHNQDYDTSHTTSTRCYVDASVNPYEHFYIEIIFANSVQVGSISLPQIYHMTPLSASAVVDSTDGSYIKDRDGNRVRP